MEWYGLEGTFISSGSTPHTPLAWAGIPPIQLGLEHSQGWGSHSFSGELVPVAHHLHSKEILPYIYSKLAPFQAEAILPCSITTCPSEKSLFKTVVNCQEEVF